MGLAEPRSAAETDNIKYVVSQTPECTGDVWIGLKAKDSNDWRWESDNMAVWRGHASGYAVDGAYTQWHGSNEPNGGSGSEECVQLYMHGDAAGNWNDIPCSATMNFVCQKNPTRNYVCAPESKSFDDAIADCQSRGGILAEVRSPSDRDQLISAISSQNCEQNPMIGLSMRHGNAWRWASDNTEVWRDLQNGHSLNGAYTQWHPGEPNGGVGKEECALTD